MSSSLHEKRRAPGCHLVGTATALAFGCSWHAGPSQKEVGLPRPALRLALRCGLQLQSVLARILSASPPRWPGLWVARPLRCVGLVPLPRLQSAVLGRRDRGVQPLQAGPGRGGSPSSCRPQVAPPLLPRCRTPHTAGPSSAQHRSLWGPTASHEVQGSGGRRQAAGGSR